MKRSDASARLERLFEQVKTNPTFYFVVWKASIEPKIQLHFNKPDPKFWFFIEVKNIKQHIESKDCWCNPILSDDFTDDGGCLHYVHNEPN